MTRKEILERIEAIQNRVKEVNGIVEKRAADPDGDPVDYEALATELDNLATEKRQLSLRLKALDIQEGETETRSNGVQQIVRTEKRFDKMEKEELFQAAEYRSAFFKVLQGKPLTEIEKRAYSSASDSAGAVIPTETAEKIFDKMVKVAPMINEITLLRVSGNLKFGVENARADAALHTENASITPASDTLTYVTLGGYEIVKVIRISKTVKTMAINAFETWLTKILSEDLAEKIEDYIINGTGSSQPKGVEKARTWTAGTTAIEYTNGGDPTYANVMDLIALLASRYDSKAVMVTNKAFLFGKLAQIADDNGNPIFVKDMSKDVPLAVMGYPVRLSDKVESGSLYLGDFTNVVGNLSQDVTIESSTQSGFLNNAIDYRGAAIFDCDIMLADAFVKLTEASA